MHAPSTTSTHQRVVPSRPRLSLQTTLLPTANYLNLTFRSSHARSRPVVSVWRFPNDAGLSAIICSHDTSAPVAASACAHVRLEGRRHNTRTRRGPSRHITALGERYRFPSFSSLRASGNRIPRPTITTATAIHRSHGVGVLPLLKLTVVPPKARGTHRPPRLPTHIFVLIDSAEGLVYVNPPKPSPSRRLYATLPPLSRQTLCVLQRCYCTKAIFFVRVDFSRFGLCFSALLSRWLPADSLHACMCSADTTLRTDGDLPFHTPHVPT
jgi:hypothetical protein